MAEASSLPHVTITTDGAARGNPGPGGWAALLEGQRGGEHVEKLVVGEEPGTTTNNAMELQAVVGGLAALNRPCAVTLRIDSTYVLQGLERILAGSPLNPKMANYARWVQLEVAVRPHMVQSDWVRGHAGDARNERVDQAANQAAQRAYECAEQQRSAGRADTVVPWTLAICSPGPGRPARWKLHTPDEERAGEVPGIGITEPTAVWEGLIEGLTAAQDVAQGTNIIVNVVTNYDLVVKQGRGEWKVKNAAQKPLATRLEHLRGELGEVRFEFKKTEELQHLVD